MGEMVKTHAITVALISALLLCSCAAAIEEPTEPETKLLYGSGYSFQVPANWSNQSGQGDYGDLDLFWGDCSNLGCVPNVNVIAMTFDAGLKTDLVTAADLAALQRDTATILADGGLQSEPYGFEELDGVPAAVTFTGDEMAHGQAAAIVLVPNNATKMYYTVTIRGSYWGDRETSLRLIVDTWRWD